MQQLDIFADSRDVALRNDVVEPLQRQDGRVYVAVVAGDQCQHGSGTRTMYRRDGNFSTGIPGRRNLDHPRFDHRPMVAGCHDESARATIRERSSGLNGFCRNATEASMMRSVYPDMKSTFRPAYRFFN